MDIGVYNESEKETVPGKWCVPVHSLSCVFHIYDCDYKELIHFYYPIAGIVTTFCSSVINIFLWHIYNHAIWEIFTCMFRKDIYNNIKDIISYQHI